MKTFKKGGIHPPENKFTAGKPIVEVPVTSELRIMLSQCIGAPSKPVVKPGDRVARGQMIAEAGGFVSAPLHSPVNGTVKKIEPSRNAQGIWQDSIVIAADSENPASAEFTKRTPEEVDSLSPEDIIAIVGDAGIVGLGGATFPTRVKLSVPKGKKATTVIINGAECEPCLTCDDALMRAEAEKIVKGTLLIMKATGAEDGIIGIESNKPEAINAMKEASMPYASIKVEVLKKKYPQGGEKQLIFALTGKTVPAGGLPVETGCIVDNVATAYAVYKAVYHRTPLMERVVTVTGPGLTNPGNFLVKNGIALSALLDFAGGLPEDTGKVVAGGPMMGKAVSELGSTTTKGLSGLVVIPEPESRRTAEGPCIRCARCVSVCPMGLEPYLLMLQAEHKEWNGMSGHGVMNCLECGSCSYICPASRPLLDFIRLGKQELRKAKI